MKKLLMILISTIGLSGCLSTELSTQGKAYDKSKEARVRLYGQNGKPSSMEVEIDQKIEKITVGGGLGQAFSSMIGAKGNESIGMPQTKLSKNPSAHSKLLSGIFFKEFIIPAGKDVKVTNGIITNDVPNPYDKEELPNMIRIAIKTVKGCTGDVVTFIPEAGKDYEVAPISSNKTCGVTVYEIK